jgi:integrase
MLFFTGSNRRSEGSLSIAVMLGSYSFDRELSKYIFHRGDGRPVGEFRKFWRTAVKAAKCPGRLFHDLRRSRAQACRKRSRSKSQGIERPACFSGTRLLTQRKCSTRKRKSRSFVERKIEFGRFSDVCTKSSKRGVDR